MDCAQGFGEVGGYCSCGEVIEYLSSVKDMGNCLNSQRSEHYCLRKDCALQGWIDAYFYYFVVKCIVSSGTHSIEISIANCFVCLFCPP